MDKGSPIWTGQVKDLQWAHWFWQLSMRHTYIVTPQKHNMEMVIPPTALCLFAHKLWCLCINRCTLPPSSLPWLRTDQPCRYTEPHIRNLQTILGDKVTFLFLEIYMHSHILMLTHCIYIYCRILLLHLLSPLERLNSCFSDMLVYGLIRSSSVTAAIAFMLEDTVL